jgi:hypothetical protein
VPVELGHYLHCAVPSPYANKTVQRLIGCIVARLLDIIKSTNIVFEAVSVYFNPIEASPEAPQQLIQNVFKMIMAGEKPREIFKKSGEAD